MDTDFVITQLVNAVIVIITTIIVTRLTLKSSRRVSQTQRGKLKLRAARYVYIFIVLLFLAFSVWRLFMLVLSDLPLTRVDAMQIAFWTCILLTYVIAGGWLTGELLTKVISNLRK